MLLVHKKNDGMYESWENILRHIHLVLKFVSKGRTWCHQHWHIMIQSKIN